MIKHYKACNDCSPILANGDASHLDFFYTQKDADEMLVKINDGIAAVVERDGVTLSIGSPDNYEGSTVEPCSFCGTKLRGERIEVLGFTGN